MLQEKQEIFLAAPERPEVNLGQQLLFAAPVELTPEFSGAMPPTSLRWPGCMLHVKAELGVCRGRGACRCSDCPKEQGPVRGRAEGRCVS